MKDIFRSGGLAAAAFMLVLAAGDGGREAHAQFNDCGAVSTFTPTNLMNPYPGPNYIAWLGAFPAALSMCSATGMYASCVSGLATAMLGTITIYFLNAIAYWTGMFGANPSCSFMCMGTLANTTGCTLRVTAADGLPVELMAFGVE